MLKNGIWLCMLGSSVLHVLILILLTRTMTASQVHMNAMETFIIAPPPVSMFATRQPVHNVARVIPERRTLDTERPLSGREHKLPLSATGYDMHPDNSRKSEIPAFEPVTVEPGPVETDNVMKAAPGALVKSHFLSGDAESKSTASFPHGTETRGEMSLGEAGAPRFIHRESPIYPFLARKLGKEGNVVLRLTLDERGGQKDIEIVVKGGFGFTEAAVQAVKKSVLSPAQKDGKPVFSRVLIPVKFVLRND